jgi:hypothetical protein
MPPVTTAEMTRLFVKEHLTLREIAGRAGISHVSVSKRLHKAGVTALDGTMPQLVCQQCGTGYRRKRSAVRVATGRFCSRSCYMAHIRDKATYTEWRYGQKLARAAVSRYFDLQPGHVVHHHDGDNRNNDPRNLAVFASQAEHMRYHRGGPATPLWNGQFLTVP